MGQCLALARTVRGFVVARTIGAHLPVRMQSASQPGELADIVQTLVESQAILASSFYIDLINMGLMQPQAAACRLRALSALAGSSLQRNPEVATQLRNRLLDYADGLSEVQSGDVRTKLRLIDGGR